MSISSRPSVSLRDLDSTRWSIVKAATGTTPDRDAALELLCNAYWYPVYGYVRHQVADTSTAEDLTQEFFAQLLETNGLSKADPSRGRFRWYLLAALKHFLSNQRTRQQAIKRGGNRRFLSLNFEHAERRFEREIADSLTPEKLFDRQWATTLTQLALQKLETRLRERNKSRYFDTLSPLLAGGTGETSIASAGRELGMSAATARVVVSRMRSQYRDLLRKEIAATVADVSEIDDEIRDLFAALESVPKFSV